MSRSDANQLNVPEAPKDPSEDTKQAEQPESQVGSILDALEKNKALIKKCPGCNSSMSDIERKMGRCLTCGKTIEETKADQGSSPKPKPKFEVRI